MSSYIFIEGLKIDAIIGIHPHERDTKQPLILDLKIHCDIKKAALSDKINYAVDYQKITNDLIEFVSQSSFKLIETLAESCANRILKHTQVKSVELKVSKPKALDTCENVGLQILRKK